MSVYKLLLFYLNQLREKRETFHLLLHSSELGQVEAMNQLHPGSPMRMAVTEVFEPVIYCGPGCTLAHRDETNPGTLLWNVADPAILF